MKVKVLNKNSFLRVKIYKIKFKPNVDLIFKGKKNYFEVFNCYTIIIILTVTYGKYLLKNESVTLKTHELRKKNN
jgi:hypothetical protein